MQSGPPPAPVPLPAPLPECEATLQLTLAQDGTIRRLVVERPGQTQSFAWSRLGEPQPIESP